MNIHQEIGILEQIVIEDKYSKHNIRQKIKKEIEEEFPEVLIEASDKVLQYTNGSYYKSKNLRMDRLKRLYLSPEEVVLEVLLVVLPTVGIHKIQNIASKIGIRLDYVDVFDGIKTASELLAVLRKTKLFHIYHAGVHDVHMTIKSNYQLKTTTLEYLSRAIYLPPMLCEPVEWETNYGGGYITSKKTLILGKDNHHNNPQNYDSINILQKVKFELDPFILKIEEVPSKPLNPIAKVAFNVAAIISRRIYNYYSDKTFYFVHRYDKRGRIYTQGYHINLQSYEYKKALLNFAKKELIS